jgi:hypothetical protein
VQRSIFAFLSSHFSNKYNFDRSLPIVPIRFDHIFEVIERNLVVERAGNRNLHVRVCVIPEPIPLFFLPVSVYHFRLITRRVGKQVFSDIAMFLSSIVLC